MPTAKQIVHRALQSVGLGISRLRDPVGEMAGLLAGRAVSNVVDGGAYRGATVRRLRARFPAATIHAFEPQQESFELLRTNVVDIGNVEFYPHALSDHDGVGRFFVHDKAYTSSLLPANIATMHQIDEREVSVRTLDSVLAEIGNPGPDVIKLDLQGHELAALRGAERALTTCRALLTEVNFRHRYDGDCSFEELAGHLGQRGFHLHRLYDLAVSEDDHGWLHGDALFIRR